jgi:sensor histidine kinase regulating citrate/malate metabolism
MAAIREAIQNGSDAARRAGRSFSEGVQVLLPTPSNAMITVIDKGTGMTKEFMEKDYLSLGSSTKGGDNGAAGGLGIGRWAAYGYIRECYITTCHAGQFHLLQFQPWRHAVASSSGTVVGEGVLPRQGI